MKLTRMQLRRLIAESMIVPSTDIIRQILADDEVDERLKDILRQDNAGKIAQALSYISVIYPDKYGDIDEKIDVETATTDYEKKFISTTMQHRLDGITPGLEIAIHDPEFYLLPEIKSIFRKHIGRNFKNHGRRMDLHYRRKWERSHLFRKPFEHQTYIKGVFFLHVNRRNLKLDLFIKFAEMLQIEYDLNLLKLGNPIIDDFLKRTHPQYNDSFNLQIENILDANYQELKSKGIIVETIFQGSKVQVYYDPTGYTEEELELFLK